MVKFYMSFLYLKGNAEKTYKKVFAPTKNPPNLFIIHYYAGVLELADKQASDTCVFNMRVQVPSPAPK